jgi:hypothetical protein
MSFSFALVSTLWFFMVKPNTYFKINPLVLKIKPFVAYPPKHKRFEFNYDQLPVKYRSKQKKYKHMYQM